MVGGSGPVQVKDSPLLLQQIDAMRLAIEHLKTENNRLKVRASLCGHLLGFAPLGPPGIHLARPGLHTPRLATGITHCSPAGPSWGEADKGSMPGQRKGIPDGLELGYFSLELW